MMAIIQSLVFWFTLLVMLMLTGCGFNERLVVREVKVPVPIPCRIVAPDRPVYPLQEAKKDESDIFVITQKALAEIELRQGYETKLEAAIMECNY